MGDTTERHVEALLRGALPEGARLYANVRFVTKTRATGPAHDGEADLVIVHPDNGLLVTALWLVFIARWLSGSVARLAWCMVVTIIGLPAGIWLVIRLSAAMTQ